MAWLWGTIYDLQFLFIVSYGRGINSIGLLLTSKRSGHEKNWMGKTAIFNRGQYSVYHKIVWESASKPSHSFFHVVTKKTADFMPALPELGHQSPSLFSLPFFNPVYDI